MTSVRYVTAPTRMPGESGREFIERMLAELSAKEGRKALPIITAKPTPIVEIVANAKPSEPSLKPIRSDASVVDRSDVPTKAPTTTLHPTKVWPPLKGQRYSGSWPPAALKAKARRDGPATLPLDAEQQAWLARYADKYPGQFDPTKLLSWKATEAREAMSLIETSHDANG